MLANIKKDAGKKELKMVIQRGKPIDNETAERLKGWRKYVKCNTVDIFLTQNAGSDKLSAITIPNATLCEYNGKTLKIYKAGERDFTPEEQQVMNEWKAITETEEYKKDSEDDMLTDGSTTFYQKKWFFIDRGYEYLLGCDWKKGCKYNINTGKVQDNKIKGQLWMEYEVRDIQAAA